MLKKRVPPEGPLDAKIVLIGEAPGRNEEEQGRPFVGGSGKLLNEMLGKAGIDRRQCYITNVMKVRPPGNDFSQFYEDKACRKPSAALQTGLAELEGELTRLSPNVIVCLGNEPLKALTGREGISKWRGSILSTKHGKVIPTYHPAAVLRQYSWLPVAQLDIRRAASESLTSSGGGCPGRNLITKPTFDEVITWIDTIGDKLVLDIETLPTKDSAITRCIGLAKSRNDALCIPLVCTSSDYDIDFSGRDEARGRNYWSLEQEYEILLNLHRLFTTKQLIAQNWPFDCSILTNEFGFHLRHLHMDTMLAAHTLYPELPKGLDFLASIYTKIPYWSDYDAKSDQSTWTYNCWDCLATYEISEVLEEHLKREKLWDFLLYHVQPAMLACVRVQQRGIRFDRERAERTRVKLLDEASIVREELGKLTGIQDFNPASPKQTTDYLYGKLRLPTGRKGRTSDKKVLKKLADRFPAYRQIIEKIIDYREKVKLVGTYLEQRLWNGRAMTNLNVAGAVTGRASSSATVFGYGSNLQNIPNRKAVGKDVRRCYTADPGTKLIKADLSQAEFRLVVWFAPIERLQKRYLEDPDFDVHRWVASLIFKKPPHEITSKERSTAKNGVYGGNYAMRPDRASEVYEIPLEEARFVLSSYREALPEVVDWWHKVKKRIDTTRTRVNPLGRRRIFFGRLANTVEADIYREAFSDECQSTVADLLHRTMILAELLLPPLGCLPLLQIHDELLSQAPPHALPLTIPIIRNIMEYPLAINNQPDLIIPAEAAVGDNWVDVEEWND